VTSAISGGTEPAPVKGLADPTAANGRIKSSSVHRWMVYDLDFKTGKIRWERELHSGLPSILRHIRNSYASETPVTDGERVYVYFGSIGLVAVRRRRSTRDGTKVSSPNRRRSRGSVKASKRRWRRA